MPNKWYVVFNSKTGGEVARFKCAMDAVAWISGRDDLDLKREGWTNE